jgi:3-deoxy-D-manno-octulosonic-acid transferase
MSNCAATTRELAEAGGAIMVGGSDELAAALDRLLAEPTERRRRGKAAGAVAARDNGVLDGVLARLAPFLNAAAPAAASAPASDADLDDRGVGMDRARA